MTPTEQTFIEVVAREIWTRLREPGCQICGWAGRDDKTFKTHNAWGEGFGIGNHTYEPRSEDPRTVDVILAAKLLGMIEERNGASVNEITQTARRTNAHDACSRAQLPCACYLHVGPADCTCPFDPAAFFRAIAREALGEGKVFEEYAEFTVPSDTCWRCGCARFHRTVYPKGCEKCGCQYPTFSRPFSVPLLNIEGGRS